MYELIMSNSASNCLQHKPGILLIINWVNQLFDMNIFPKINSLKELSGGHQLLKIIKVFFEEQNFTSSYSKSINFDIIKTFFEDKLGIEDGIDYVAAANEDENEIGIILAALMIFEETITDLSFTAYQDQILYYIKNKVRNNNIENLVDIISEFLQQEKNEMDDLVVKKHSFLKNQISIQIRNSNNISEINDNEQIIETKMEDQETDRNNLQVEIISLRETLRNVLSKNHKLEEKNNLLEKRNSESNEKLKLLNTTKIKLKQRNRELKSLLKEYDKQLEECKKSLSILTDDYCLINRELTRFKKKMISFRSEFIDSKPQKSDSFHKHANNLMKQENSKLRRTNAYYKSKYVDLQKHVLAELSVTIEEITKKNEHLLEGNMSKIRHFEEKMEKNLQEMKDKNEKQNKELKQLEIDGSTLKSENLNLKTQVETKSDKLAEIEKTNVQMLLFIQMQADEILKLSTNLKRAQKMIEDLEKKNVELLKTMEDNNENHEVQIKELYNTITEVFMERIEELKKENDQLKYDPKGFIINQEI